MTSSEANCNAKVGIVTVTYNSAAVLPDFFTSLWSQTHTNFILYAVDNASKDSTLAQLRAETDPRLHIEASPSNLGVAEANNIGIRRALEEGCDAVLLLNNDVVFSPTLIATLVARSKQRGGSMVAPKMMYHDPANKIWWAGGHFQRTLGYRAVHTGLNQIDIGQCDTPMPVDYCPTCCVLVNRAVFQQIGLMDPKYFVYWDDTDFMLRALRAGIELFYEPAEVLYHKVSSLSGGKESPFLVRLLARNRVYFWSKHMGIALSFVYTAALTAIYILKYSLRLKSRPTLALQIRGMLDGLKMAACQT